MNEHLFDDLINDNRKNYSTILAEGLLRKIIRGDLPTNYTFPNENVLCKKLNVSRSTLREAYKILDTQGFIERTKQGTYVKNLKDVAAEGRFNAALYLSEYHELIEFILLLEPEAIALAATRATREQLTELEKYLHLCEENVSNLSLLEEYNSAFHSQLRLASNNSIIISSLSATYNVFDEKIIKKLYTPKQETALFMDECIHHHQLIFQALVNKEPDKAKKIAKLHLLSDLKQFERLEK